MCGLCLSNRPWIDPYVPCMLLEQNSDIISVGMTVGVHPHGIPCGAPTCPAASCTKGRGPKRRFLDSHQDPVDSRPPKHCSSAATAPSVLSRKAYSPLKTIQMERCHHPLMLLESGTSRQSAGTLAIRFQHHEAMSML